VSRARFRIVLLAVGALVAASCSLDPEETPTGADSGQSGTGGGSAEGGDAMLVPDGCVQPGDQGNELGIGTYCSPGGNQCSAFALAPLCLADAVPEEGEWFCTRLCTTDDMCGSAAFCLVTDRGSACVPNRCVDGGGAGSRDAASDVSSDTALE